MTCPYTYPVWSLTVDDSRNNQLADMQEESLGTFYTSKRHYYDTLQGTLHHNSSLYELLDVLHIASTMVIELFRCNLNVLNTTLPEIDIHRIRNVSKRTLGVWRHRSSDLAFPFSLGNLIDLTYHPERWDAHKSFTEYGDPKDWNGVVLSRLSDIHKQANDMFVMGEARCLLNRPEDADFIRSIGESVLPAMQAIHREFKDYTRIINSL